MATKSVSLESTFPNWEVNMLVFGEGTQVYALLQLLRLGFHIYWQGRQEHQMSLKGIENKRNNLTSSR